MRKLLLLLMAVLVVFPAVASAQTRKKTAKSTTRIYVTSSKHRDCCWGNRWHLEPYAGAFKDAYDISPDGKDTGLLLGLRVGYLLGSRTRLLGNLAYSKTDDIANSTGVPSYFVYDNTWVFTTGGAEFDVVPGRTSASLGLQAGAAWRRIDTDGLVGTPSGQPEADRGFSAFEVVVPALVARHRLTQRTTLTVGLHDYIFDFLEGPAQHSLALTAGFAFR